MTIALRVFSVIAALVAALFLFMSTFPLQVGKHGLRDILAGLVFLALAILAIRCVRWLWRKQRFWSEKRSLREVATLAAAIVFLLPLSFIEQKTSGAAKDVAHILYIASLVAVYLLSQRHVPTAAPVAREP